jgi:hypothetical protein
MENVKGIFEGTRPIREGTTAIGLCLALLMLEKLQGTGVKRKKYS